LRAQPPYLTAAQTLRARAFSLFRFFGSLATRTRTHAQARNKTLGIATFDVHEDPFEPGTFHFWERYDTTAAMSNFNSGDSQQAFEAKVLPLLKDGIGMMLYEWNDGKLGAPAMPIGARRVCARPSRASMCADVLPGSCCFARSLS
jgi:quinol monooxygenase YgiN